jgi:lipopolysaccharide export system permease protein
VGSLFSRYVAKRFVVASVSVFVGIFLLVVLIDYIEMTRRAANAGNTPAIIVAVTSLSRVPLITERLLPFSVLVGAMMAYLNLSRRNELVIARAAGMSAWQFVMPAVGAALVVGLLAAAAYNPLAAALGEQSKRLEEGIFGSRAEQTGGRFWLRQRTGENQSILQAGSSRGQGEMLNGVSVFVFDPDGAFVERIEAESAKLQEANWKLTNARVYRITAPPREAAEYDLATNLSPEQVRESFATPETVSFWQLPDYIATAERAGLVAAAYRFQYQSLLARPFLLAGMVLLASAVSLRFFRFGGVQKMILFGLGGGFLLYVLSKVTEDMSKAALMHPVIAAWCPVLAGGLTGVLTLLSQEDG